MMDELDLIADTARRILAQAPAEEDADGWSPSAWRSLERAGLTRVGVPEEIGGSGGDVTEAAVVLHAAGYAAAPVPLAEATLVGGWLLAQAGIALPDGPLTAGSGATAVRSRDGWALRGTVRRVPWGGICDHLALLADSEEGPVVALVERTGAAASAGGGRNLAGEPRDTLELSGAPISRASVVDPAVREGLRLRGALSRVLLMTGAAERALALTTAYARERAQFGRPIARFQAVQHQLARLAAETAAMRAAAALAVSDSGWRPVAAAKVRAGRAAAEVAAIAHQVHGALGFTWEHRLRAVTTRLWAWREEYGGESEWAAAIGAWVLDAGPAALRSALDDPGTERA
jgi:acyl-CoA dehydrogenase